jgi:hypothetical protein
MIKRLALIVLYTFSTFAFSGTWTPDLPTIVNLASTFSWATKCSARGFADSKKTIDLGNKLQAEMSQKSYQAFNKAYQNSLHKNAIYSVANKKWLPYKLTKQDCKTADSVVNMFLLRLGGS